MVGFPSLRTTHAEFMTPFLAAPGACVSLTWFLGLGISAATAPSGKHFKHSCPGGFCLTGHHPLGEMRLRGKLYVQQLCACACTHRATVAQADITSEITVLLSFLRSLSSFPFSIYEKLFIGIGEVVTQTQTKIPCKRKETKFLVAAAGQTPLFDLALFLTWAVSWYWSHPVQGKSVTMLHHGAVTLRYCILGERSLTLSSHSKKSLWKKPEANTWEATQ